MACGFGACYGCVVPARGGGYLRVCVDGPGGRRGRARARRRARRGAGSERVEFCGLRAGPPGDQRLGHVRRDRRAARVRRAAARARFPFAAFVSKTITLEPRAGNPPPRLWEAPAGLINSIGLPNKGLERYLREDLPELARAAGAADHERDGLDARRRSASSCEACEARAEIAAVELNVSCPNVRDRAWTSAPTRASSSASCGAVRAAHGQAADRQADAQHAPTSPRARRRPQDGGRGRGLADQHAARRWRSRPRRPAPRDAPWLGRRHAAACPGPGRCAPVALAQVAAVAARVAIPVVGMGGVQSAAHARELLDVGRDARGGRHRELPRPAGGARIARELESESSQIDALGRDPLRTERRSTAPETPANTPDTINVSLDALNLRLRYR